MRKKGLYGTHRALWRSSGKASGVRGNSAHAAAAGCRHALRVRIYGVPALQGKTSLFPVPPQPRRGRDRLALYKRRGTEPERAVSRYCNAGFRARCRFSERRPSGAGIDRSADARNSDKRCSASGRPPCPGSSNAGCGRLSSLSDCGQRLAAAFLRPARVHTRKRVPRVRCIT